MSVEGSDVPSCPYFVFEYVAPIVWSCWSDDVPQVLGCVPSDFAPTQVDVIELNWVVLAGSCGYVDKVSRASSDSSPPCFFEIDEWYVSFSSIFDCVWRKGPAFSSRKARHDSLVLMLRCH